MFDHSVSRPVRPAFIRARGQLQRVGRLRLRLMDASVIAIAGHHLQNRKSVQELHWAVAARREQACGAKLGSR